ALQVMARCSTLGRTSATQQGSRLYLSMVPPIVDVCDWTDATDGDRGGAPDWRKHHKRTGLMPSLPAGRGAKADKSGPTMPCSSPNSAQFGTPKEKAEQIEADLGGEIVTE